MKATERTKNCELCGKLIKCPYRLGIGVWNKKRFCSEKCFHKSREKQVKLICQYCGKEFSVCSSWAKYRKRCSKRCEALDKKGKRFSPSTEIKKGQHISPNTELKKGEDNRFWKGGIATANKTARQREMETESYKNWRWSVFNRDNYTCRICGQRKGHNLTAHHILPYSKFPELKTNISNGVTLCKSCHIPTINKEWKYIPRFINI
jgi:hypothetical protein